MDWWWLTLAKSLKSKCHVNIKSKQVNILYSLYDVNLWKSIDQNLSIICRTYLLRARVWKCSCALSSREKLFEIKRYVCDIVLLWIHLSWYILNRWPKLYFDFHFFEISLISWAFLPVEFTSCVLLLWESCKHLLIQFYKQFLRNSFSDFR